MTRQDKLIKLIEIAIKRGWEYKFAGTADFAAGDHNLFDHDFAKAIWGEEVFEFKIGEDSWLNIRTDIQPAFKYHLQQAVISEDPLEYYWKNK